MDIPENWTFENKGIAASFDLHVREQLPFYELATNAVAHIVRHYLPQNGLIYDIGASTGNIGKSISPILKNRSARLVAIESSEAMVEQYQGPGEIVQANALSYQWEEYDVAVCFLSIMFFPVEARPRFIAELRRFLRRGGAIVILDKQQPGTGYSATVLWRLILASKVAAGIESDQIIAKELSLGGVQRPVDPAIFGNAIEWFRFGDFAGWLIEG